MSGKCEIEIMNQVLGTKWDVIYNVNSVDALKCFADESVDFIFTDPPFEYGHFECDEIQPFFNLIPEFYRILRDNSFFAFFFPIKYLYRIAEIKLFDFFWQIIFYSPYYGGFAKKRRSPVGFHTYDCILVYKKGNPKLNKVFADGFMLDRLDDFDKKDYIESYKEHPTPKTKFACKKIIEMFSKEGDVVLDAFAGSGTIPLCSFIMNRRFIAIEISERYCKFIKRRIENYVEGRYPLLF